MENTKIKLAFSGGGFRATFYSLGAYKRLVELGLQQNVSHITSVSGGSITAGAIMCALKDGVFSGIEDFDERVTKNLINLGQVNLRKKIISNFFNIRTLNKLPRGKFSFHLPRLLDWHLYNYVELKNLPTYPEWSCNTTCLNTAKRFRFKVNDMYGYKVGTSHDLNDISVSFAVAASAAFPIMFAPLKLDIRKRKFFDKYSDNLTNNFNYLYLTDGGVYDNLGSENILKNNDYPSIILDASANMQNWSDNYKPSYLSVWNRILNVSMDQIVNLRRRLLFSKDSLDMQLNINHTTDHLLDLVETTDLPSIAPLSSYSNLQQQDIEKIIGGLRTDLDAFHDIEIEYLMWTGAVKIDLALKTIVPHLITSNKWLDIPEPPPYPSKKVKKVLLKGQQRKKLGKLHKKVKSI